MSTKSKPDPDSTPNDEPTVAMTEVEWGGRTWEVAANPDDWPLAAVEALELGRGVGFLRAILGRRQMAIFSGPGRTARDANQLMDAIIEGVAEAKTGE